MRVRIALKCAALLDLGLFSSHQESLTLSLDQLHNATLYGEPRDMLGDIRAAYWFDTVVRLSMHKSATLFLPAVEVSVLTVFAGTSAGARERQAAEQSSRDRR